MGGSYKYCRFFRFRSTVGIDKGILVERSRLFWLVEALKLIDFNYNTLITEVFGVGQNTNVFSYIDLRDMDFKSYEFIVKTAEGLVKK